MYNSPEFSLNEEYKYDFVNLPSLGIPLLSNVCLAVLFNSITK